jgi:hypothetical protein
MDMNDQLHAPAALSPEEKLLYLLDRSVWAQSQCGHRGEEVYHLCRVKLTTILRL